MNRMRDLLSKWESSVLECLIPAETAFLETLSVEECHNLLRRQSFNHEVQYFYVIDAERHLKGVVSARHLLLAKPEQKLSEIAKGEAISIHHTMSVGKALEMGMQYELLAFPVVNDMGQFIGLFEMPVKELIAMHGAAKETSLIQKQLFQLMGMTIQKNRHTAMSEFQHRMPWLLCNLFGGLACAWIASDFGEFLSRFVALSFFIPLVLTLGESIAMQSMTLAIAVFSGHGSLWKMFKGRFKLEIKTSILLAISCAILTGLISILFPESWREIGTVSLSVVVSMMIVALYGVLTPAFLKWRNLEPKVASGPFILMITDITITAIYLFVSYSILVVLGYS